MRRLPWIPISAVGLIVLAALAAPVIGLADPVAMDVAHRLAGPSAAHPLGQDEYGRDVLTRLIWGARTSLGIAFAAAALACVVGTILGLVGGYLRGVAELLAVRSMDVVLCFPPLLLALLVVTLLGPGASTLIPVLAIVYLPSFTRVAYAGVLSVRGHEYVTAMKVLGAGRLRIMTRTILPNIAGPVLVQFSLAAASAVVLESGLSFLGLGVVPPAPSWGLMIGAARGTMVQAPLLLLWPCLALTVTILAMNALCDGLRDVLDPHPAARRASWFSRFRRVAAPVVPERAEPGTVLDVRGLTVAIGDPGDGKLAVRDVSFHVREGETLAIVGESGSGKSLMSLSAIGMVPAGVEVSGGTATMEGKDLLALPAAELRKLLGDRMAMIFQDPGSSLNPVHRVGSQIAEAIRAHRPVSRRAATTQAVTLLRNVGIPDPERRAKAFPHELSGGMRQRVMIAMAIANGPRLLVADEPTTALDVTIQAQVLDLLASLKRDSGLGLLFITHSLPVVAEIADRVAVMYAGEILEEGPTAEIFADPRHPYTAALLRSAPKDDGPAPEGIPGSVPVPGDLPAGCVFAPRCDKRIDTCVKTRPPLFDIGPGRASRCIRWASL